MAALDAERWLAAREGHAADGAAPRPRRGPASGRAARYPRPHGRVDRPARSRREQELRDALPREIHERALEQLLTRRGTTTSRVRGSRATTHYVFGIFLVPICVREEDRVFYQEIDLIATRERLVTVRKTPSRARRSTPAPCTDSVAKEDRAARRADGLPPRRPDRRVLPRPRRRDRRRDRRARGRHRGLAGDADPERASRRCGTTCCTFAARSRRRATPIRRVVDRPHRHRRRARELLPREIELDFADVYDKLLRAMDGLDLSRDLLSSARDYHQAKIANDQNEVMKRLTVIASRAPRADLHRRALRPELPTTSRSSRWGFGYWWSWGWILVTTDRCSWSFFRWLGWIGGEPLGRPKLPPLARLDPRTLARRRRRQSRQATLAACRTSSARTARSGRSTTTGARA